MVIWSAAVVLAALSALTIGANWFGVVNAVRSHSSYSPIPIIGGILGCSALLLVPVRGAWWFAWVPLVLDYSVAGLLYATLVLGAFRSRPDHIRPGGPAVNSPDRQVGGPSQNKT